jgi:hypothetical protein
MMFRAFNNHGSRLYGSIWRLVIPVCPSIQAYIPDNRDIGYNSNPSCEALAAAIMGITAFLEPCMDISPFKGV